MLIIGLNKGKTDAGRRQSDGSLSLIKDGKLLASIMEERACGKLREGGFEKSLEILEQSYGIGLDDADYIGISTCMEPVSVALNGLSHVKSNSICEAIPHHLSHAYGAYSMSGFREALVIVLDGGGNILSENNNPHWWEETREQHSYYYIENGNPTLLCRDFENPYEMGFGEIFRSACYFMGFNTSRKSANIMALSSYGDYKKISSNPFWSFQNDKMVNCFEYDPLHPENVFEKMWPLIHKRLEPVQNRKDCYKDELLIQYADFCAYLQWNIETAIIERLKKLKKIVNTSNLCITGGVALNCVMNAKIAESGLFNSIYVPFCPGDHGQSLGNAMYLSDKYGDKCTKKYHLSRDAYLGGVDLSKCKFKEIAYELNKGARDNEHYIIYPTTQVENDVAGLIKMHSIVCTAFGRSEFGYRALGNRSILSKADDNVTIEKVKLLKNRKWFRPFAPAVLKEDYTSMWSSMNLEFMSYAVDISNNPELGYCQSPDKRSRVQLVDENCRLGRILKALKKQGESAVCLNTSFNLENRPIVDSLGDVIETFKMMECNILALDENIVVKKMNHEILEQLKIDLRKECEIVVRQGEFRYRYDEEAEDAISIMKWIMEQTGCKTVYIRRNFGLNQEYMEWLKEGSKSSTLRFKNQSIEYPQHFCRGMWKTKAFEKLDESKLLEPDLKIRIQRIEYCRFGELNEEDAKRDGFVSLEEMKSAFLNHMYPDIQDEDWMTIYFLKIEK